MSLRIHYEDLDAHKHMLGDRMRCEAYRRALAEVVRPDSIVVDIGAGTGLLSVFAAQAGAKKVYAIERTKTADLARKIIADNGLTDRVEVLQQNAFDVELPEPVDIVVSEFMGGCGIDENVLPAVIHARNKWLKPKGVMIPNRLSTWMAPAFDEWLDFDANSWTTHPYGVDLKRIGEATYQRVQPCRYNIVAENLLSTPQSMWDIDLLTLPYETALRPFVTELTFRFQRKGRCNAMAAWFEAHLNHGNTLSNKPSCAYSHWGRWVLPIGTCRQICEDDSIAVRLAINPQQLGKAIIEWEIHMADYRFQSTDACDLTPEMAAS